MGAPVFELEDVLELLEAGESPERIAARVGASFGTIARRLQRRRHPRARDFSRLEARERHGYVGRV